MTQSQAASVVGARIAEIARDNLGKKARDRFFTSADGAAGGLPELWCADFARWVWNQAGVLNTGILSPAAGSFGKYGPVRNSSPQVGDAVLFGYNGTDFAEHVAIVVQVNSDGTIVSIGGDERGEEGGTDAHFAGTSCVAQDGPYNGAVGSSDARAPGHPLSGYVSPRGGGTAPSTSDFPVVSWGANRLDVFVTGPDHAVNHKAWHGDGWTSWQNLGGKVLPACPAPAAVSWGANRLDAFVVGTDHAVYRNAWDGDSWSGWENLGGTAASNPQVASWGANRLDVFVTGPDHAVNHKAWHGDGWTSWQNLGGIIDAG
jgi:CHAP domain